MTARPLCAQCAGTGWITTRPDPANGDVATRRCLCGLTLAPVGRSAP